jgi:hypothetical protein
LAFACASQAVAQPADEPAAEVPAEPAPEAEPTPEPPASAPGADVVAACLGAFKQAQVLRDAERLRAARRELAACADPVCPAPVSDKCRAWDAEVARLVPTLLVRAHDHRGRELGGASVIVDDEPLALPTGVPIELDPGSHAIRVDHATGRGTARVVLAAGKPAEVVVVIGHAASRAHRTAPDAAVARPDEATPAAAIAAYSAFAVAGVGLLMGIIAGGVALADGAELEERCASAEGCPQADIDAATAVAHTSTAGFVIAGAGAAAGIVALVVWSSRDTADDAARGRLPLGPSYLGLRASF